MLPRTARREWRDYAVDGRHASDDGQRHVLKLKLIAVELRNGKTNCGESILASAIADLVE